MKRRIRRVSRNRRCMRNARGALLGKWEIRAEKLRSLVMGRRRQPRSAASAERRLAKGRSHRSETLAERASDGIGSGITA
eukprot:scaffold62_cov256-Pinguiococcus_pyrenoidosus.AAC.18